MKERRVKMENALEIYGKKPLTAAQIKAQVQLIQEVMEAVMIEGKHYGKIPGTPKPTLYKPGAEKLLSTFHIGADPSEFITDLSTEDEIRYRIAVKGFSQAMGNLLGVGIGECSSNEDKYKWRKPVCDPEFDETPADRKRIVWKHGEKAPYQAKQVRMNPSDIANTILKMAKKRALVDMTLTITAASDIFDQDLEDLPEGMEVGINGKPPIKEPQKKKPEGEKSESSTLPTVTVAVEKVTSTSGKKRDGSDWTLYIIHAGNQKYSTFSKTQAETAKKSIDEKVNCLITYEETEKGLNLKEIALEAVREPGEEG
jgi:hypothetical protein